MLQKSVSWLRVLRLTAVPETVLADKINLLYGCVMSVIKSVPCFICKTGGLC